MKRFLGFLMMFFAGLTLNASLQAWDGHDAARYSHRHGGQYYCRNCNTYHHYGYRHHGPAPALMYDEHYVEPSHHAVPIHREAIHHEPDHHEEIVY